MNFLWKLEERRARALVALSSPRYKEAVPTTRTPRQSAGALIRSYRERAGLTLAQLAERAGLSRRTLQRYEAGDYALGTDDVLPLALALDLDDEGARAFAVGVCGLTRVPAGSAAGARAPRAPRPTGVGAGA